MAALLLLAGCGGGSGSTAPGPEPAVVRRHVRVDGAERVYRLYTPPDSEREGPVPLVLALHGSYNSVDSFVDASELDDAASANGFIVAYPEAVGLVWNGGFCCTSGRGSSAADISFLDRVITDVAAVRRIDLGRVYAVGVSAGGVMAYRLGCDLAGKLAGVAAVAGAMALDDCHPSRPVPVIAIHGTADGIVPYEGGRIQGGATRPAPPAAAVVERWATLNGCTGAGTPQVRGAVTIATWTGCAAGSQAQLVTVEGGGHNWFLPIYGPPNGAIDATRTIVEFFAL
ncbi:MAG TPA: PHB depolymerase family esterase [Acidimicrobiales bacterium]|nr:PHB depolymerase family esterase [Acidimicrobiales bacterium]